MTISAIVTLQSETERSTFKSSAVELDRSFKSRVSVWRSREPNPSFAAHRKCERRSVTKIPGNFVAIDSQMPSTGIVIDDIVGDGEHKRSFTGTQAKSS
jgi:hypothetical protein